MNRRQQVSFAIAYGIATHIIFAVAVIVMVDALYQGLTIGLGTLHGWKAFLADALLVLQFPLVHSFLLTARGRSLMSKVAPGDLGRDLGSTTFVLVASLQLLATFSLWSPSGVMLDNASGAVLWLFRGLFVASWLFLIKALTDSGLGIQMGFIGWTSVVRDKRPDYGSFPTHGLFRYMRHPVYLGFALVLWTMPVHTLDAFLLAVLWTVYCVAAPRLKEKRYLARYGTRYEQYRKEVPYMWPRM